ncbi:hypothetical protein DFJ73DRAFT_946183 [Zopfochytrium polystomum]|nr:hypothetical protein DFJ73DRAFT_946183 [Zopfochytrium polystomum]
MLWVPSRVPLNLLWVESRHGLSLQKLAFSCRRRRETALAGACSAHAIALPCDGGWVLGSLTLTGTSKVFGLEIGEWLLSCVKEGRRAFKKPTLLLLPSSHCRHRVNHGRKGKEQEIPPGTHIRNSTTPSPTSSDDEWRRAREAADAALAHPFQNAEAQRSFTAASRSSTAQNPGVQALGQAPEPGRGYKKQQLQVEDDDETDDEEVPYLLQLENDESGRTKRLCLNIDEDSEVRLQTHTNLMALSTKRSLQHQPTLRLQDNIRLGLPNLDGDKQMHQLTFPFDDSLHKNPIPYPGKEEEEEESAAKQRRAALPPCSSSAATSLSSLPHRTHRSARLLTRAAQTLVKIKQQLEQKGDTLKDQMFAIKPKSKKAIIESFRKQWMTTTKRPLWFHW